MTRMRFLPAGSTGMLVELSSLDDVLALYAALLDNWPPGVIDIVPAAYTVFLDLDTAVTAPTDVEHAVSALSPRHGVRPEGKTVEVPVSYEGTDLDEVADMTGLGVDRLIQRHTSESWTVAFCGFAPGFAYMVGSQYDWNVPRRTSPRTTVPQGAVALASSFASVYPQSSPGGWQLIGSTELTVFDLDREPPVLLTPGTHVRFVDAGANR